MLPLLTLLLACGPDQTDDSGAEPAAVTYSDPSAPGPWAVGTDADTIMGSSGVELEIQAWYPRADAEGALHAYDDLVEGGAVDGGQAACDEPRPVLVFSHGNAGMRWQSFFLTEHMASHGWVVVAPDHTHNTFSDDDESQKPALIFRRPVDIADTFDHLLQRSQDPADRLHGCVDEAAGYAIAGHSFGGFTTLVISGSVIDTDQVAAWCSENGGWLCDEVAEYAAAHPDQTIYDLGDDRAWAAAAIAPAAYETLRGGLPLIELPTMIVAGSLDDLTPWETEVGPIWQDLQVSPRAVAEIEGAGHFSFSDICSLIPTFSECTDPFLEPAEVHGLTKTVVLAWFQAMAGQAEAEAWLPPDDSRVSWQAP